MSKRRLIVVVAGLMLGMFLAALDSTVVSTAMPTVISELGGMSNYSWVFTAYMLASTTSIPIFGKLSDIYGRRLFYVFGLALFMLGSALSGAAQTMTQLIIFRGLQGIGGGAMMPISQTIVGDLFPGELRAKWQGVFGGVWGLAAVLGPQIGGWIVDFWNWRWVFYINLPLGVASALVIFFSLKESRDPGRRSIDYFGAATMAAGVVLLLLAMVQGGQEYAWTSSRILGYFALSAVLLGIFLWIQTRVPEPILPLGLFRHRIFTVANIVGFLTALGMFGAITFIPLFMQGVVGLSARQAGSVMTPLMLAMVVGSAIGGRLLLNLAYRTQVIAGMIIVSLGFFAFSTMGVDTNRAAAIVFMIVTGFGLGLVMPTMTIAVQNAFPREQRGVVTSSTRFFGNIGGTLGVAILGTVMNARASETIRAKFAPLLEQIPAQMAGAAATFKNMIDKDPQALFQSLLHPEALGQLPGAMREGILTLLRESLADSLHGVFLVGLVFVALAVVAAFFMGSGRLAREGRTASEAPEAVAAAEKRPLPEGATD